MARSNARSVHIYPETLAPAGSDTYGARTSGFDAGRKTLPARAIGRSWGKASVEHGGQVRGFGSYKPLVGLPDGLQCAWENYITGLGTAAGEGVQASETFLGWMMQAALGAAAVRVMGSVVTGTPAVNAVDDGGESTPFAVRTVAGFVLDDGTIECRPIVAYGAPTITPAFELSSIPSATNLIYGSLNVLMAPTYAKHQYYLNAQIRGQTAEDSVEFYGVLPSFSIPTGNKGEGAIFQWEGMPAGFLRPVTSSLSEPGDDYPWVRACESWTIAPANDGTCQTGTSLLVHDWGFSENPEPVVIRTQSKTLANAGHYLYAGPELRLLVDIDSDPPGSASRWSEVFENPSSYDWQLFNQAGDAEGKIATHWWEDYHLADWPRPEELDQLEVLPLTFRPNANSTSQYLFSQL